MNEEPTLDGMTRDEWIAHASAQAADDCAFALATHIEGMIAARDEDGPRAEEMAGRMQQYFMEAGHARCAIALYEITEHLVFELANKVGGLDELKKAFEGPAGTVFAEKIS